MMELKHFFDSDEGRIGPVIPPAVFNELLQTQLVQRSLSAKALYVLQLHCEKVTAAVVTSAMMSFCKRVENLAGKCDGAQEELREEEMLLNGDDVKNSYASWLDGTFVKFGGEEGK
jgi:hypothetical protein